MNKENKRTGVSFFGLLTILFIGLKLSGFIGWSWWLVLGPLWIPTVAVLGFMAFALLIAFVAALIAYSVDMAKDKAKEDKSED